MKRTRNLQSSHNCIINLIVARWSRNTHLHPQSRTSSHQFPSDIVHIAHPSDFLPLQNRKRIASRSNECTHIILNCADMEDTFIEVERWGIGFIQGQKVGKDLSGVPEVGKSINDWYSRILSEFLLLSIVSI